MRVIRRWNTSSSTFKQIKVNCTHWWTALTSNWFSANEALFGEHLAKAFLTEWLVVASCESLSSQGCVTVGACKTLLMPRIFSISNATGSDDLDRRWWQLKHRGMSTAQCMNMLFNYIYQTAFFATSCVSFFVASGAEDKFVLWHKTSRSNCALARGAHETALMPHFSLVFHLLHAYMCSVKKVG